MAASLRRGGTDRILVPDAASRPIDELCAAEGVGAGVWCHEIVQVPPGGAPDLLAAVRGQGESAYGD